MLFQSCVVYHTTSTPINQAYNKGMVMVVDDSGEQKYKSIELNDGVYYGVTKGDNVVRKTPIDTVAVSAVYLKDIKKSKIRAYGVGLMVTLGVLAAIIGIGILDINTVGI
jgi:hypothetical protein